MYTSTFFNSPSGSQTDWAAFGLLLKEYARDDLKDPHLSSIWKDLDDLSARYAYPVGGVLLLKHHDIAIGCMAYTSTSVPSTCEVKRLFVRSEYRGKGLGVQLMKGIFDRAKEAGYRRAALSTWEDNSKALLLYENLGFISISPFKDSPEQKLVFLGKDL